MVMYLIALENEPFKNLIWNFAVKGIRAFQCWNESWYGIYRCVFGKKGQFFTSMKSFASWV